MLDRRGHGNNALRPLNFTSFGKLMRVKTVYDSLVFANFCTYLGDQLR